MGQCHEECQVSHGQLPSASWKSNSFREMRWGLLAHGTTHYLNLNLHALSPLTSPQNVSAAPAALDLKWMNRRWRTVTG